MNETAAKLQHSKMAAVAETRQVGGPQLSRQRASGAGQAAHAALQAARAEHAGEVEGASHGPLHLHQQRQAQARQRFSPPCVWDGRGSTRTRRGAPLAAARAFPPACRSRLLSTTAAATTGIPRHAPCPAAPPPSAAPAAARPASAPAPPPRCAPPAPGLAARRAPPAPR